MKKIILALVICNVLDLCAYEYKPLLTNGKKWKVLVEHDCDDSSYYKTFTVAGDTVVNNINCKKIIVESSNGNNYKEVAYEDAHILYKQNDHNGFSPMINFNLHKGDIVYDKGEGAVCYIVEEDYITVKGVLRKRLKTSADTYWVDGIGSNCDFWIGDFQQIIGSRETLTECSENGNILFTKNDFDTKAGINEKINTEQKNNKNKENSLHSIDGKRISKNTYLQNIGIYITNGKKVAK